MALGLTNRFLVFSSYKGSVLSTGGCGPPGLVVSRDNYYILYRILYNVGKSTFNIQYRK